MFQISANMIQMIDVSSQTISLILFEVSQGAGLVNSFSFGIEIYQRESRGKLYDTTHMNVALTLRYSHRSYEIR